MKLTVKDLIEKLSSYPTDTPVLVEGYEGGYTEILEIKPMHITFNQHKEDWLGPHEEDQNSKDVAVVLLRKLNLDAN